MFKRIMLILAVTMTILLISAGAILLQEESVLSGLCAGETEIMSISAIQYD